MLYFKLSGHSNKSFSYCVLMLFLIYFISFYFFTMGGGAMKYLIFV